MTYDVWYYDTTDSFLFLSRQESQEYIQKWISLMLAHPLVEFTIPDYIGEV